MAPSFTPPIISGRVHRSLDDGLTWELVLPEVAGRAIAIDPLTPTTVYVGDRQAGVYRSWDAGQNWTAVNSGLSDTRVNALAVGAGEVYAGAHDHLFHSQTYGEIWSQTHTFSSSVQVVGVHPITPTTLYVGTFSHGLWRSDDGGENWQQMGNGIPPTVWLTDLALDPHHPQTLYATTWEGDVYRTTNGGDTWQAVGEFSTLYSLTLNPNPAGFIYVGSSQQGVFRGGTLAELTIDPIASPQQVNQTFPLTITTRDALGLPLSQPTFPTYNGLLTLADTTRTISPTQVQVVDGQAVVAVSIGQAAANVVITATTVEGIQGVSQPFDVFEQQVMGINLYLPLVRK